MLVSSARGLFWSMNWDSWEEPKNSFTAAVTGLILIRDWGISVSTSWVVMRSRTTLSMRERPIRYWFCKSSPTARIRRLPRWSISSDVPTSSSRCIL